MDFSKIDHHPRVITYVSPRQNTIDICPACEAALKVAGEWPRDWDGQEFCTVGNGLHMGFCSLNKNTYRKQHELA